MPPLFIGAGKRKGLAQALKLAGEVAHQLGFPGDFEAALDAVATVIHVLQRGGNHVHVVVGINTARDAEAHEVVAAEAVLARDRVAVGEHVANLAGADAGFEIEFAGQCLGGELLFRDLGQHLVGIDEDGVATSGTLVGNAVLVELGGEVIKISDFRVCLNFNSIIC